MNSNRNDSRSHLRGVVLLLLVLALAACGKKAPEPVMSAPPPPPMSAPPPPPPPPSPPPVYRVASGSPAVLTRFPRGTLVTLQTEICLKQGEQITMVGSNGQSVTYNRPGCLRRNGRPTGENAGGFTFGWSKPVGRSEAWLGK